VRNRIGEAVRAMFAPKKDTPAAPPTNQVAWASSVIYANGDFPKYNPDELIGRMGHKVYAKMMLDEQLKAVVVFRRNAVTSRGWAFEFDDDAKKELSEEEQEHRIRVLTRMVNRVPGAFRKALNGIMAAQYQGFSITEKEWEAFEYDGKTYWGIKRLAQKPFETFSFHDDEFGNLVRITQEQNGKRQEIDPKRVIHYVYNPEVDEFYGQSELRAAYRDYFSKDVLTKLENIYLERMAGGLVWAERKDGAAGRLSPADALALQNVLSHIQTKTGIMMPDGYGLNVEGPTSTDAFEKAINRHDRGMAKALLMPSMLGLTDQGNFGGFSQAQTQQEGFLWMLDSEAADLAECLNEQLFKEACEYNWGDGLYPSFYFKPLSKSQTYSVLDVWNKLIQSGTVEASDTDETYVRKLLEFPEKGEPRKKPQPPMVPGQQPPAPNADGGDEGKPNGDEPAPGEGNGTEKPPAEEGMSHEGHDHTFFPEGGAVGIEYKRKAFTKAQRRVDFSAIERSSTMTEWQGEQELGSVMTQLAQHFANVVKENDKALTDPKVAGALTVPKAITAELKKLSKRILAQGWETGVQNAKREVEKAGANRMSKERFAKFSSVGEMATKYFEAKSFQMAGGLTAEALKEIQTIILNGIKYNKTQDEVIEDIYRTFARKGMITEDDVREILGKDLDIGDPTFRLRTVVRTNTFEAINEARFDFFTDPELNGFVTALEYSAILDGRTTDVCNSLDGKVYPADSSEWNKYRPPNHFNCRSLLVAVTQKDDIAVSTEPPNVEPQEGFK